MSANNALYRIIQRVKGRIIPTTVAATADTDITADQALYGVTVTNAGASGAVTFALPAAQVGMRVRAVVKAAQELRLDPDGTETIALPSTGAQSAAGKYITADAVGESVDLQCVVDGAWETVGASLGTWTAEA